MKNKLFAVMGCSLLSILLLAGCFNRNVQNPPPPVNNTGVPGVHDNNRVNDHNTGVGDHNKDINTHNDGVPAVDGNTPR